MVLLRNALKPEYLIVLHDKQVAHYKYYSHLKSDNERYYLGAYLLEIIKILPNYRNIDELEKDENAYKKAMISNFKKAVKK